MEWWMLIYMFNYIYENNKNLILKYWNLCLGCNDMVKRLVGELK